MIRLDHTVFYGLEVASDVGERAAQLMCDIRNHVLPQLLIALQVIGHGVESGSQFTYLAFIGDVHPL